jgi:hypothetical protein
VLNWFPNLGKEVECTTGFISGRVEGLPFDEVWGRFEMMGTKEFCDVVKGAFESLDNCGNKLFEDMVVDFGTSEMGSES